MPALSPQPLQTAALGQPSALSPQPFAVNVMVLLLYGAVNVMVLRCAREVRRNPRDGPNELSLTHGRLAVLLTDLWIVLGL